MTSCRCSPEIGSSKTPPIPPGRLVIQIARYRGLHTVNVVRRPELIPELQALGADVVVTDDALLSQSLPKSHRERRAPRLERRRGRQLRNLALQPRGTLVNYGG